jgi:hypothetical protein
MEHAAFGQFFTTELAVGNAVVADSFAFGLEKEFRAVGEDDCGCGPVECDPCCATCPD